MWSNGKTSLTSLCTLFREKSQTAHQIAQNPIYPDLHSFRRLRQWWPTCEHIKLLSTRLFSRSQINKDALKRADLLLFFSPFKVIYFVTSAQHCSSSFLFDNQSPEGPLLVSSLHLFFFFRWLICPGALFQTGLIGCCFRGWGAAPVPDKPSNFLTVLSWALMFDMLSKACRLQDVTEHFQCL